jgi:phosphoribosyl-AMP cyclohydrolase
MSSGKDFFDRLSDKTGIPALLGALKWDADGLVAVVSQDAKSKDVLGVAFADRTALQKSLDTGLMHYYSRSRKKLWLKGEQSGHFQKLVELRIDCDGDAILAKVRQVKGNCHLGFHSCFSYRVTTNKRNIWSVKEDGKRVFNPEKVYKKNSK